MHLVTERSDEAARSYGIEVVDVRIKKPDCPLKTKRPSLVRQERRGHVGLGLSLEGEEQALTIRAETDLTASQILAEAEEEARRIRGAGDAEALRIYAAAYEGATTVLRIYAHVQIF